MALTGLAIAAALGLAKSELVDKPAAERSKKLAGATQRLSPWTGLKADKVKEADPFGTALQFGAVGAQMGSAYSTDQMNSALTDKINSGAVSPRVNVNSGGMAASPWDFSGQLAQMQSGRGY